MEQITISRIGHFGKDKNGNPLVSKTGKPYERCLIDTTDGRKISGFGSQTTRNWRQGDTVGVEIEKSGDYWNFSIPKAAPGGAVDEARLRNIEEAVKFLCTRAGVVYPLVEPENNF